MNILKDNCPTVDVMKINKKALLPKKAHATDACYDLYANSVNIDNDGNYVYGTGIAMNIPEGCAVRYTRAHQ